jgi:hypothetical protein
MEIFQTLYMLLLYRLISLLSITLNSVSLCLYDPPCSNSCNLVHSPSVSVLIKNGVLLKREAKRRNAKLLKRETVVLNGPKNWGPFRGSNGLRAS